jgi:hypothetical protein
MKTVKLIRTLFIILMMICISAISTFATTPEIAPALHLQKVIKEGLKYPERAVQKCCTGKVDVEFTIDEFGKINIKNMSTDNTDIAQDVKLQLAKINCKDVNAPSYQLYKITITFKLEG